MDYVKLAKQLKKQGKTVAQAYERLVAENASMGEAWTTLAVVYARNKS